MARILLVLVFMTWCEKTLPAIPTRQWHNHDVHCGVKSLLHSPFVSAYLQKEVHTQGCTTNGTVSETGAEVHVINYHGNTERNIELFIEYYDGKGLNQPAIIVLVSQNRVYWQVKMRKQFNDVEPNIFVVSAKSVVRFTNKNTESRPSVSKIKDLPTNDNKLLLKVTEKFSMVTTFTSFNQANHVTVTVGGALHSSSESVCTIHAVDPRSQNIKVMYKEPKSVEGCLMHHRSDVSSKHAYVIELKHVHYEKPFEVNLELRRLSHQTVDKEFWLVLKSPSHVTWHVYTKKVQGFINIVANSFVDMSGIRMHTVAVRSEELKESGLDLLRWVEYFLVPIAMYTSMNNTNHIQITLPKMDESEEPEFPSSSNLNSEKSGFSLKMALQTECGKDWVVVAIDKHVLEHLGIKKSMLSMLDPQCTAMENSTHVYIKSAANGCGTNILDNQDGKITFLNSVVVHISNMIIEESHVPDSQEEGSGLDDVLSGSGDREHNDLILDDEDLELHPLKVNIRCEIDVKNSVTQPSRQPYETVFELNLLESNMSGISIAQRPVSVAQIDTRLYIQATVTSDLRLRAHLQNCWLTDVSSKANGKIYLLVENGCTSDKSVRYLQSNQPQSEMLSFTFENFVKHSTSSSVDLECQLTVCCIDIECATHKYPTCVDAQTGCENSFKKYVDVPVHTMTVGPISIPKLIINTQDTGVTDVMCKDNGIVAARDKDPIVIVGLDSATVVAITFATFIIGAIMMGALWFIHTHSGSFLSSGRLKQNAGMRETQGNEEGYVETTPGSCAPIST